MQLSAEAAFPEAAFPEASSIGRSRSGRAAVRLGLVVNCLQTYNACAHHPDVSRAGIFCRSWWGSYPHQKFSLVPIEAQISLHAGNVDYHCAGGLNGNERETRSRV